MCCFTYIYEGPEVHALEIQGAWLVAQGLQWFKAQGSRLTAIQTQGFVSLRLDARGNSKFEAQEGSKSILI